MKPNFEIDKKYLYDAFERVISVPSPVGYYGKLNPVLKQMAAELGYEMTFDNKHTAYVTIDGEDNSKTVLVGSHADTLGLMVRAIESNGMLSVYRLGGAMCPSLEGESVTVITRDGREYTGLVICKSHSSHVFEDAHKLHRTIDTLRILLDEDVHTGAEVRALGIQHGDYINIEPRPQLTEKGYVKSRFIDDKGAVACSFEALRVLRESGCKPKYRTIFAFPHMEELGFGASFVPAGVSEYVAVDIGLIGPELDGDEKKVSICTMDSAAPYDFDLTNRLIELAKDYGCDYAVDTYPYYQSDCMSALRGGNDLIIASFGMAVYCSHGMERTHIDGLANTAKLLVAYVLEGSK